MKYITFILFALLISCNKEDKNMGGDVIDIGISIFIKDVNGNNLLVDTSSNAINADSIRLVYLINGSFINVYNENLDCPYSICYMAVNGNEHIAITPNHTENDLCPITYIDWGNGDIDTLKCHFNRVQSNEIFSILCDTVWFNETRMFPDSAIPSFGRAFMIIK